MKQASFAMLLVAAIAATAAASLAVAQQAGGGSRAKPFAQFAGMARRGHATRMAKADSFGRGFNFCRAMYTSGSRREAGGHGWATDYPDAELNFSIRLAELTHTRVSVAADGGPEHVVVPLVDGLLYQCPYIHMEDAGTAALTDKEVEALRAYLLKGGFLWVDDYWGTNAWHNWAEQLGRVLPADEYPIEDIPADHPVFTSLFEVKKLPQIPSVEWWRSNDRKTSERGQDSTVPTMRGVMDRHDNLMVVMTHNTDISDSWEREGGDAEFYRTFSPDGYRVGINVVLYAMTH